MGEMFKPVIFAGPSIYGLNANLFGDFDMRPPARNGDLLKAVFDGAQTIGLIDGVFGNELSVWHKEILHALNEGVKVFGAASMGALRAAECSNYGMIGVGRIYDEYSNNSRISDADVAISHAPEELGFRPLTLALVDAEATILHHINCEKLSLRLGETLLVKARALRFADRTWAAIVDDINLSSDESTRLLKLFRHEEVNQKRLDAMELLATVQIHDHHKDSVEGQSWIFQKTAFFEQLRLSVVNRSDAY